MHRYNFDIPATLRLRELIAGYGRMRGLEEMTVQQRGPPMAVRSTSAARS